MTRATLTAAALVAAVVVFGLSLPPRRTVLADAWDDGTVRGVLHVHSRKSDGRGSIDEIAAAAARVGLRFVVTTDHGDGTRPAEPPSYHSGVLCIDGAEISTRNGHYLAIGMETAPYPLGGDSRGVAEDVRRLGGFGAAAHPDSPREELRWSDWTVPIDGAELLNLDTGWRVHAFSRGPGEKLLLLGSLFTYPFLPAETIARLATRSEEVHRRWVEMAAEQPIVGLAGVDAHAKLSLVDSDEGGNRFSIPIPSYESSFGALSLHVMPARPFTGDAPGDADSLLQGIRQGRVYVSIDGWAGPAAFEFSATDGARTVGYGESMVAGPPITLRGRSNAPAGYSATVWRGTSIVRQGLPARAFELTVGSEPGVYRAEIRRSDDTDAPAWLAANPIYVRGARVADRGPAPDGLADEGLALMNGRSTDGWSIENDATSLAAVDVAPLTAGPRIQLRYGLAGGDRVGQYAAATAEVPSGAAQPYDGVAFSLRGERPMRVSVQVRAEEPGMPPQRWQRSVYVDTDERSYALPFDDMRGVGETRDARPRREAVRAVMFVVDTTNNQPGASGRLWIGRLRLARRRAPGAALGSNGQ